MQKLFKKNYNKIGILGGTFDPPHIGHLHISKIALKKLRLDAVIWVITKQNPLKQKPYLSTKTRMSLSKGMTKSQKKIFVEYLDDKIKSRNTFDLLDFLTLFLVFLILSLFLILNSLFQTCIFFQSQILVI